MFTALAPAVLWCATATFSAVARPAQTRAENQRALLGVSLSPPSTRLLERVEALYGKRVVGIENPGQPEELPGQSTVEWDGTPKISINPSTGKNEAVIAHELMHLFGFQKGVPWVHFVGDSVDSPTIRFLVGDLYDQVFHSYFYPKLREIGIDPSAQERAALHDYLVRGSLPVGRGPLLEPSLALYYFRSVVLLRDEELTAQLARVLSTHGQEGALSKGRQLVAVIQRHRFHRPTEVLDAFLEGAKALFASDIHLSLCCLKVRPRGNINLRTAIIFVEPVQ